MAALAQLTIVLQGLGCFAPNTSTESAGSEDSSTSDDGPSSSNTPDDGGDRPDSDDGAADTTGSGGPTDAGDDEDSPSGDDDSSPGCSAGTCFALVDGWEGPAPVRFGSSAEPPACADGEASSWHASAEPTAPEATCGCSCGELTGSFSCGEASLSWWEASNASCLQVSDENWEFTSDSCIETGFRDADTQFGFRMAAATFGQDAGCEPQPEVGVLPIAWATEAVGCEPASNETCDRGAGVCGTSGDAGTMCVWQEGEHECPSGPYTARSLLYQGIEDERGCTACTCGGPTGRCDAEARLSGGTGCGTPPYTLESGDCLDVESPIRSVSVTIGDLEAECPPSDVSPTGTATPIDPITVCCSA